MTKLLKHVYECDNKGERGFWLSHVDDQNGKDKNQLLEFWHHLPNFYLDPNFPVITYTWPLVIDQTAMVCDT